MTLTSNQKKLLFIISPPFIDNLGRERRLRGRESTCERRERKPFLLTLAASHMTLSNAFIISFACQSEGEGKMRVAITWPIALTFLWCNHDNDVMNSKEWCCQKLWALEFLQLATDHHSTNTTFGPTGRDFDSVFVLFALWFRLNFSLSLFISLTFLFICKIIKNSFAQNNT